MDAGDIAEGLFEIAIGVICILASIFGKNDRSEDAKFIRKYGRQLLVVFGVLSLFRGAQVYLDEKKTEPELTSEEDGYAFTPDQHYELDETNNPIYKINISEQQE